jgi:hypothetical protein
MARSVQVVISADARGMGRGVAQANAQLRTLQTSADKSQQSLAKIDGLFSKFSQGAVAAAGIAAVGASIMQVVNAASALQQAQGSVEAIFDVQAAEVIAGASAWQQYGLSQSQALQSSALLGNQLKQLGYTGDTLTRTTDQLLMTAADMAATFGGTTPKALEALQAALRGSYARLDEFGINISETMVSAKAASEGLTTQQAALGLILAQSGEFAGQATRELDTFASRQQAATAAIQNAKENIGQGLLPVATQVAAALGGMGGALAALPPQFVSAAGSAGVAVAAFKTIQIASGAAAARLAAMEVALGAAGKPTRALGAGLASMGVDRLGAALGVATVGLIGMQAGISAVAESMRSAVPDAAEFTRQLKEASNALSDIGVELSKPWYAANPFQDLGRSADDLAASLDRSLFDTIREFGTEGGLAGLRGEEQAARQYFENMAAGIKEIQVSDPQLAAARTRELFDVLARNIGAAAAGDYLADLGLSIQTAASAAAGAAPSFDSLTEALKRVADAKSYMDSFFASQSAIEENAANQTAYREAVAATADQIDAGGRSLQGWTANQIAAGRASRNADKNVSGAANALIDQAKTARDAAVSLGMVTGSSKAVAGATRTARAQFITAARAAGIQKQEAVNLANALGLVPKDVKTVYKNSGAAQAKNDADAVRTAILSIPTYREIQIVVRRGDAVQGQLGPAFENRTSSSLSVDGQSSAQAYLSGMSTALRKWMAGDANVKKLFKIEADTAEKNRDKLKQITDDVVRHTQDRYERLYARLRQLEQDRAALAKRLAEAVTAFSIADQLSAARDAAEKITALQTEAAEATMQSWSHLDPIIAELQTTTDPVRLAELRNTYATLIAAGPRTVADTARRAELEAQIAQLRAQDDLSEQIAAQVNATAEFAGLLRTLKQQGLSPAGLAEIAQAGPQAGLELARQLAANAGLRDQWAMSFRLMKQYSAGIGQDIANATYKVDVRQARATLRAMWKHSADDMEDAINKKLRKAKFKAEVDVDLKTKKSKATAAEAPTVVIEKLEVNGAIDPEGTARAIRRILKEHAARAGR